MEESRDVLWVYPTVDSDKMSALAKEFSIHKTACQILLTRSMATKDAVHDFLYARLPQLHDPDLFVDMEAACRRILKAIDAKEPIVIYGDNDVDGMTGTALLAEFFRFVGANVYTFVPERTGTRQGLLLNALEFAESRSCRLFITVDCGITAAEEVDRFFAHGIDVIVTDHHEPTDRIPHCIATLNPKLLNSTYPNRELTGVGVAFKLIHGVTNRLVSSGRLSLKKVDLKRYLDLVALGTISDMGALVGENRILVRYGLAQIQKKKRLGLAKLMEVCEVDADEVNASTVASKIAPRLNSLGRIADPRKGVELLLLRGNVSAAQSMAQELDLLNSERQRIERGMQEDLDALVHKDQKLVSERAIVIHSERWHPGVIAILATRMAKLYNRPACLIAIHDGIGKGSIRSIPEYPLLQTLKRLSSHLLNFGGHDYAAGLTIKVEEIDEFRRRFIDEANETLKAKDVQAKLFLDAPVRFDELSFEFMESLSLLEPFGSGHPMPMLYSDAHVAWPAKIVSRTHLKMFFSQGDRILEGIGFGMANRAEELKRKETPVRVVFTPQINRYQKPSIQLLVKDFKVL